MDHLISLKNVPVRCTFIQHSDIVAIDVSRLCRWS
jgi:hypothetical protein